MSTKMAKKIALPRVPVPKPTQVERDRRWDKPKLYHTCGGKYGDDQEFCEACQEELYGG